MNRISVYLHPFGGTLTILTSPSCLHMHCTQRKFISPTEIDDANLKSICDKSFPLDAFDEECYIPIKDVGSSLHIAELFHGPTFCFKDFG
jgi:threonine synthase